MRGDNGQTKQGKADSHARHGEEQFQIGQRSLSGKQQVDKQPEYHRGKAERGFNRQAHGSPSGEAAIPEQKAERNAKPETADHGKAGALQCGLHGREGFRISGREQIERAAKRLAENAHQTSVRTGYCRR